MLHVILSVLLISAYFSLVIVVLLLHELGHILVSLLCRVPVHGLGFAWKGAYTVREAGPPHLNIWISAAGPLMNLIIGSVLWNTNTFWHFFAIMNFVNAGANLLPITGSDGDRIITCWQAIKREKQCHTDSNSTLSQD